MNNEFRSNKTDKTNTSVTIGDVSGGIHHSIIADGDVYVTKEQQPPLFVGT